MQRNVRSAIKASCLAALAVTAATTLAQQPDEPLGDLLDVIPLPEQAPAAEQSPAADKPPPPAPAPAVAPGDVLAVELPPSAATGEMLEDEEVVSAEEEAASTPDDPEAAAAEAAWAERQEQRRAEINAVESPIVDQLNAEMAERAAAAGRRFAAEQAAYERSLTEREADIRRREAEHAAEMEAYARRVAREQAEHRARVAACLAGDRSACAPK